jgi:hypothetical protein
MGVAGIHRESRMLCQSLPILLGFLVFMRAFQRFGRTGIESTAQYEFCDHDGYAVLVRRIPQCTELFVQKARTPQFPSISTETSFQRFSITINLSRSKRETNLWAEPNVPT